MDGPLWAALDEPLPERAWCGAGTSWYLAGWCFHEEQPVEELEIVIGEQVTPVLGRTGRRPDVHAALPDVPTDDRRPLAFWALVDLVPDRESPRSVRLRARLADGTVAEADLGHTTPVRDDRLRLDLHSDARVAIAMATYEPPVERFAAQIATLRAQTFTDWVCVVCDDGSSQATLDRIVVELSGDPRFVLARNHDNVGHYRNFERALRLLPHGPELVALSDQDDLWYPEKLARTVAALDRENAVLVATDCRLVQEGGRVRGHLFEDITANVDDLCAGLITSTLAGASMVFRRTLLEQALPFPPTAGEPVHDHWLATAAIASGKVTLVAESTYDWVQHSGNALGWPEKAQPVPRAGYRTRELPTVVRGAAGAYFALTIPIAQRARTLALRGAADGDPEKQALLESIGGPGAGVRREQARLTALATSRDRRLLRGADRYARMGAIWMAAQAARRHARLIRPRWHRRVAASSLPTRPQTARCDDGPVPVLTDPRAVFAPDRPRTVALAAPVLRLPPIELMHRVGAAPEGESQVATFYLVGRGTAKGVREAAPEHLRAGSRVLDFGCGAGRTLRFLLDGDAELVLEGCDIDSRSVEWMERNLPGVTTFTNQEVPPIDRPDGSYDLIYVMSVFTHLADTWSAWMTELHRLLAPGGVLIVTYLGYQAYELMTGRRHDPDRVGMAVIHLGEGWDNGGPMTFHSEWWIREHWGRAFEVIALHPLWGDWRHPGIHQGAVVMRRREVEVTPELFERWSDPERERLGLLDALDLAHDETARWRDQARVLQHALAQFIPPS